MNNSVLAGMIVGAVVLAAAARHGCLMEVNGQPSRLNLDDVSIRAAERLFRNDRLEGS